MNELTILKWAAGDTKPLPRVTDVDEDLILESTLHHRLEGRLLRRLKLEPQPWAGEKILQELKERQSTYQSRAEHQLEFIRSIHREYSLSGQTMILIKSFSPYFLLGDAATIRFSWDVDILSDDSFRMQEALSRLGYQWSPTATVDLHHSPRASRYDLDFSIDSYNYIPVWSYPKRHRINELNPGTNPGIWRQTARPRHEEIRLGDVIDYSVTEPGTDTDPLLIPDATMTVLIVCTHIFTDFLHGLPGQFGRLPLARFAEIIELCRHPDFSRTKFAYLVRNFNAFDSVQFTTELLLHYFGYNPLSYELPSVEHKQAWRRFYRSCFWLPEPCSYDELLLSQDPDAPLRHLLGQLGSNEVSITDYSGAQTYWALGGGRGTHLERIVTRNEDGHSLPIGVRLDRSDDRLIVEVRMVGLPDTEDLVFMEVGGLTSYWAINREGVRGEGWKRLGGYDKVDFLTDESGYKLSIEFSLSRLHNASQNVDHIPMLIAGVRMTGEREDRATIGKSDAATLIPINIVRY